MIKITANQGKELCKLARDSIEEFFTNKKIETPDSLKHILTYPRGVFVTIYNKHTNELRGCIGYPIAKYSLGRSLKDAAIGAGFKDNRFMPLKRDELQDIKIEVSILSEFQKIKSSEPEEIKKEIKIGRDGLAIEHGFGSGLLLPQVAIEYGWNVEKYLTNLCRKAMLSDDMWADKSSKLYKFQAVVFSE